MGLLRAMLLRAGQWAAPKPQLGADPRPAGPKARPRPALPAPRLLARRTSPPPARPPPARPAHSPADGLVGQLLHAVELLLHGGGGGGGSDRPRGSGSGELGTVWRVLPTSLPGPGGGDGDYNSAPPSPRHFQRRRPPLPRVGPSLAERGRNQRGGTGADRRNMGGVKRIRAGSSEAPPRWVEPSRTGPKPDRWSRAGSGPAET